MKVCDRCGVTDSLERPVLQCLVQLAEQYRPGRLNKVSVDYNEAYDLCEACATVVAQGIESVLRANLKRPGLPCRFSDSGR